MKKQLLIAIGTVLSLFLTGIVTYYLSHPWQDKNLSDIATEIGEADTQSENGNQPSTGRNRDGMNSGEVVKQQEEKTPTPIEPPPPPPPKVPYVELTGETLFGAIPQSFSLAVASSVEEVPGLVLTGIHHLLTNREDIAGYCFQRAAALDFDCTLAHWGLFMAYAAQGGEKEHIGLKALEKIRKEVKEESLPAKDRGYLEAAISLADKGAYASGEVYQVLAARWKADLAARALAGQMFHDRYDEAGQPRGGQALAIELLDDALETNGENHLLLFNRALMEETAPVISEKARTSIMKAAELAPNHPSTSHLQGHILFRTGHYKEAAEAYTMASLLFDKARNPLNTTLATDETWLKSLLCAAVARYCQGNQEQAFKEALKISLLPADESRPDSPGTLIQHWEAAILPAKLALAGTSEGVLNRGLASLPRESEKGSSMEDSSHVLLWKAVNRYLKSRLQLGKNEVQAEKFQTFYEEVRKEYLLSGEKPLRPGVLSYWVRGKQLLDLLSLDLKARLNKEASEIRWEDAADKQAYPSLLLPPILPFPVEFMEAEYIFRNKQTEGRNDRGLKLIAKGLQRFPHHASLLRLQTEWEGKSPELPNWEPISEKGDPLIAPVQNTSKPAGRKTTSAKKPPVKAAPKRTATKKPVTPARKK